MTIRRDEPSGAPGLRIGASMKRGRLRGGDARTDQLQSEIDQEHEPSTLDRDGEVEREPAENTREARDGEADETGIEIDHAAERPRTPD